MRSNGYAAVLVAVVSCLCAQERFLYVKFMGSSLAFQPPAARVFQRRSRVQCGAATGRGQVESKEPIGDTASQPSHHKNTSDPLNGSTERYTDGSSSDQHSPPKPRRDEDRRLNLGTHASISDPYGWMRDDSRVNAEVQAHIEEENAYTRHVTRNLRDLERTLVAEYQQTMSTSSCGDISDVFYGGDYIYYTKRISTQSYAIHCRKLCHGEDAYIIENEDVAEEIVLDENELAAMTSSSTPGNAYLAIHTVLPSPSHRRICVLDRFQRQ